jgi:hypothetical protein
MKDKDRIGSKEYERCRAIEAKFKQKTLQRLETYFLIHYPVEDTLREFILKMASDHFDSKQTKSLLAVTSGYPSWVNMKGY